VSLRDKKNPARRSRNRSKPYFIAETQSSQRKVSKFEFFPTHALSAFAVSSLPDRSLENLREPQKPFNRMC